MNIHSPVIDCRYHKTGHGKTVQQARGVFNARLINLVYDELIFDVLQKNAEAAGIIRDQMGAADREYLTCVPVVVEANADEAGEK